MVVKRGFTLIEILVVISIIVVLVGLVLAVGKAVSGGAMKSRTGVILGTLTDAINLAAAERGGLPAPAEHPLAGSAATRPTFIRANAADGSIDAGGTALRGVTLVQAGASKSKLLLDDDILSDRDAPHLFGLRRGEIGLLGVPQQGVTHYQRMKVDRSGSTSLGEIVAPTATPAESRRVIEFILGHGDALGELTRLGGVADTDQIPTTPILGGTLERVNSGAVEGRRWVLPQVNASGWKSYLLPGLSLVDAWGREVLYTLRDGKVVLESAGADGAFRIDPGRNRSIDSGSDARTLSFAGDDTDGRTDNVITGASR
ncbi:MAG: prepilin-type N-terminal cleavage/methylation domain-containing protein [Planctomycetota bacterium]|nr:prepilin-type N-terminal cleavage/methylation domain-containing protein [Planctomycetota bacterium]